MNIRLQLSEQIRPASENICSLGRLAISVTNYRVVISLYHSDLILRVITELSHYYKYILIMHIVL